MIVGGNPQGTKVYTGDELDITERRYKCQSCGIYFLMGEGVCLEAPTFRRDSCNHSQKKRPLTKRAAEHTPESFSDENDILRITFQHLVSCNFSAGQTEK